MQVAEQALHVLKELKGWSTHVDPFEHDSKEVTFVCMPLLGASSTVRLTGRPCCLTGDRGFRRPELAVEEVMLHEESPRPLGTICIDVVHAEGIVVNKAKGFKAQGSSCEGKACNPTACSLRQGGRDIDYGGPNP